MYDCKVIVKDIFANDETGKSKALIKSEKYQKNIHQIKYEEIFVCLFCLHSTEKRTRNTSNVAAERKRK